MMKKVMTMVMSAGLAGMLSLTCMAVEKTPKEKRAELQASLVKQIQASKEATPEVKLFIQELLLPLWTNPAFVKDVKTQNAKAVSLDEIKLLDEQWKNAEDELPVHKEKMGNACAREIKRIVKDFPVITEAFVMDNQGANVGQNTLTSDYWQGDEAKWQNAYNEAKGGVEIGKVEFDKSANAQLQQISLPIIDENVKVIGAICFGVDKPYAELVGKLVAGINACEKASPAVKTFAKRELIPLCMNSVFIKDTQAQNAREVALDEIKKLDQAWKDAEDELPIHVEKMNAASSKQIGKFIKTYPAILEAFVMDNQGANVAQNTLTSDYWQGDEAKWQNSYNEAKGGVEIGDVEFDKSANAQLQQISLPIIDGGEIIGAICWGVNTDTLQELQLAREKSGTLSK